MRASGDYHIERGFSLPARAISHLPDMTARSITAVARSGFTVTAVHAGDDTTALAAMNVLHAAAASNDHHILWCSPHPRVH